MKFGSIVTLREAAAFNVLGLLTSEDIPSVAVRALEQGYDSPALQQLAAESTAPASNITPLFARALSELSVSSPERNAARLIVARFYARRILDGTLSPYEGACKIWLGPANDALQESEPEQVSSWLKLRFFIGLASEYEVDPEHREAYEREIVNVARELDSDPEAA
jgi:hypothetical protein